MRKWAFIIGSVVVSGLLLYLTLRDVPLNLVWETIQRSNLFWVLVSFLSVGGALFTRGIRWRIMLANRITTRTGFYIFSVTMLFNQLPLRAGEVVRVLLATRYGVPAMTSAASVVVERLIDVVTVVVLVAVSLTQIPDVPEAVARTATIFGALAIVGFAVLIGFAARPSLGHKLAVWLERVLPFLERFHLQHQVDAVLVGLKPLTNLRIFAGTILWTVIAWSFSLATFIALERAIDLQGVNYVVYSMLAVGLAALGVAVPMTLASIGPFQVAVVVAGELLGANPVDAAALGLLFHGITLLGYAVFGGLSVLGLGVSFQELFNRSSSAGKAPDESAAAVTKES